MFLGNKLLFVVFFVSLSLGGLTPKAHALEADFFPRNYDFGGHDPGEQSQAQDFLFTNFGEALEGCDEPIIEGDAEDFVINHGASTCSWGSMAPGETCVVSLFALPQSEGVKHANLIRACEGGSVQASVRTFGFSPKLFVTPQTFDFGSVVVDGASDVQVFTLINSGKGSARGCEAPQILGENYRDFSITSTSTCEGSELASGESCEVHVQSTPHSAGVKTATLSRQCEIGGVVEASFIARVPTPFPDLGLSPPRF